MKVLWISNVTFPEACSEIGIDAPVVGGWMASGAKTLLRHSTDIKLIVASLYRGERLMCIDKYAIKYYLIPAGKGNNTYDKSKEKYFKEIINLEHPQLIHIHGSEYPHSLACVKAADGVVPIVLSIQGLVCVYARYFLGGIETKEIKKAVTLKDILKRNGLIAQQQDMERRGEYERELICSVGNVIGRTSWDKSCVWAISPDTNYYFCNETLRSAFYTKKWDWNSCDKHTIFLSQGHYPIKGLHKVLEALPLILRHYPNTRLLLAGHNIIDVPIYRLSTYGKFCKKLIEKNNLSHVIEYMGILDEQSMAEQYQKANVFVCPSSIENSPNSVGEAQLVGTPVVASYVGGTMDMIKDGETGFLYRFEETSLLAMRICQIFGDEDLCRRLSKNERETAALRHNGDMNAQRTINIYNEILGLNANLNI